MSTYSVGQNDTDRSLGLKLFALFAGITIPVVMLVGLWLAISADKARHDARQAAREATTMSSMPGMAMPAATSSAAGAVATGSFAGAAPADADAIAMRHAAVPATLAPAPVGAIAHVRLDISHSTVSIAPGVRYDAWTFGGTAPGPAIHVRVGQKVVVTMKNDSPMPHSVDFHAAQVAPNVAFSDVLPGQTKTFSFVADVPGVFMYHCGTAPAFMHIANGMYGAIVVEPSNMPPADKQYVLVGSEWYLDKSGLGGAASLDVTKAEQMTPDWVTWNGYAGQYKTHPLTAEPGQTVRFWVVDAGPSLNTDFHVVGTVLSRAWVNADLVDPPQHDIQTAVVPAGGGGVFDVKIDQRGLYPFVSHSFASVQLGQVGVLDVGNVPGTMNH
ncbi:MAG TPA: multicopper oxidase domain-containing protein [Gaiellaceae bacterium]|jgi:nitrite reductase (NO-forming)|nr:multicopper oxidase domain-containing protein [Gaiellaceae bacterium]